MSIYVRWLVFPLLISSVAQMQHAFICANNSSNELRKAKSTSGAFISVGKSLNFRFVLLRLAEDALTSFR